MLTHLSSSELLRSLFVFLSAIAVSLAATPLVKKLAFRFGAIDVPKDARRIHKKPIPLWGGIAIYLGFIVSVLIFVKPDLELIGILAGATLIVILGAVDDRYELNAKVKFLVQIIAAVIPIACGLRIEILSNYFSSDGSSIALSFLSVPLTLIWIVGVCNAVNLIDGLDGLACGVSTIAALSTFLVVIQHDNAITAAVIAALAGACIGFLPYNFNPAKIFMGDSGALFLGFILATVSISGNFKMHTMINFGLPFVVLGLPIFDTTFAILRRVLHGKKPWEADRGHIHHKLIDSGMSQKQAVSVLYAISAVLGMSAVLLTNSNWTRILIMGIVLFISAAIAVKLYISREAAAKAEKNNSTQE